MTINLYPAYLAQWREAARPAIRVRKTEKHSAPDDLVCRDCDATLTMAEYIEGHCVQCARAKL